MTKVLRKYKKWFLGVAGALLMVTFLLTGPQSIFQPDPSKQVVATVGTRSISQKERMQAESEYEAVKEYVPGVERRVDSGDHWLLLTREVEGAGLVGGEADARRIAEQMAPERYRTLVMQGIVAGPKTEEEARTVVGEYATRLHDEIRPQVAARHHLSLIDFDTALSKYRAFNRLAEQHDTAARISDRRAELIVRKIFEAAVVDGLVISAEHFKSGIAEPTEAEVVEQFTKFKETKPGTGEFGFGYLQPQRIKYEYLMLDRAAFRAAFLSSKPKDDLDVAVYTHYQKNRSKFTGEWDDAGAKTTSLAVLEDYINQQVDGLMGDAERAYQAALKPELREVPQDNGFRKLPADWAAKGIHMAKLAQGVSEAMQKSNIAVMPVVGGASDRWVRVADLSNEAGIGAATFRVATSSGDFRAMVQQLREFNPTSAVTFQALVPSDMVLTDGSNGNRYFVNVTEWRAESAPESIEEVGTRGREPRVSVRQDVVRDLKLKGAYEVLIKQADDIRAQAITAGLDAVAKTFATPAAANAASPDPVPLAISRYSSVRADNATPPLDEKEVREAVIAQAHKMGVKAVGTPENLAERTLTVAVPGKMSLAVVQILGMDPLTVETMREITRDGYQQVAKGELAKAVAREDLNPFSFDQLKKRYDFKLAKNDDAAKKKK